MELDSARGLKLDVTAGLEQQVRSRGALIRGLDLPAARAEATVAQLPSFAVGIAVRRPGEYELAVRIQNRAAAAALDVDSLRARAKGEIDIRFIGRVQKRGTPWHQARRRPLLIGSSVSHPSVTAGTLGAFVRPAGGRVAILSNNHVLADENAASVGDRIIQPGTFDGGDAQDAVARLESFVPLDAHGVNHVDAAIATLDDGVDFDARTIPGIGELTGAGSHYDSRLVAKAGRTTGVTQGFVSAFELDNVIVGYDLGALRFDDQFEIDTLTTTPFSRGGDSGSLIVDAQSVAAVGLLFAGSETGGGHGVGVTFAAPIDRVLQSFDATL